MKYISIGDVVGKPGIEIVAKYIPKIKRETAADFVIVNIENMAEGSGVDKEHFNLINSIEEIDCFVLGNHTWDKSDILSLISNKKMIRPLNYKASLPGKGMRAYRVNDKDIVVIQLIGRHNIKGDFRNPFKTAEIAIDKVKKEYEGPYILVDFHAETTAESIFMGHFLDGKVSSVLRFT